MFLFCITDLELLFGKDGNKFESLFNVNRHVKVSSQGNMFLLLFNTIPTNNTMSRNL